MSVFRFSDQYIVGKMIEVFVFHLDNFGIILICVFPDFNGNSVERALKNTKVSLGRCGSCDCVCGVNLPGMYSTAICGRALRFVDVELEDDGADLSCPIVLKSDVEVCAQ